MTTSACTPIWQRAGDETEVYLRLGHLHRSLSNRTTDSESVARSHLAASQLILKPRPSLPCPDALHSGRLSSLTARCYCFARQLTSIFPPASDFLIPSHGRDAALYESSSIEVSILNLNVLANMTRANCAPRPKSPFPTSAESVSYTRFSSPRMALRRLVPTD